MGSDKGYLLFNSLSLIEWQVKKLASLGIEDVMVSGSSHLIAGTRSIPDIHPDGGPLGGIQVCLIQARNESCLILGVDTPLIPADFLLALIAEHERGGIQVTLASHRSVIEPLVGVYDRSLIPLIDEVLISGKKSVRRLLDLVPYSQYSFKGDDSVFLNCNTPDDYARLLLLQR